MGNHKEIKRLSKSVKRRRLYAENLKLSAREIEIDNLSDEDVNFARRLRDLAEGELARARAEEKSAKEMKENNETRLQPQFSSEECKLRHEKAMAAMAGKFSIDRARFLVAHLGKSGENLHMGEAMNLIETLLDISHENDKPLMMKRLELAEIKAFGKVRF